MNIVCCARADSKIKLCQESVGGSGTITSVDCISRKSRSDSRRMNSYGLNAKLVPESLGRAVSCGTNVRQVAGQNIFCQDVLASYFRAWYT